MCNRAHQSTFFIVSFLSPIFSIKETSKIIQVYFQLFALDLDSTDSFPFFLRLIFAFILIFGIDLIQKKLKKDEIFLHAHWIVRGIAYAFLIVSILAFSVEIRQPFTYQEF